MQKIDTRLETVQALICILLGYISRCNAEQEACSSWQVWPLSFRQLLKPCFLTLLSGHPHHSHDHFLLLYNTHTAERIDIVYRHGDAYIPDALAKLDFFLRDHRTGDVRHFDPRLYDILSDLTAAVGRSGGEIDIVCGYRTSSTNEFLRAHATGVAKNSLHIQAEAIDLRMPGIATLKLRKAALALARGGVGYYPHSDFIHLDVGRVRQWCFDCPTSLIPGD